MKRVQLPENGISRSAVIKHKWDREAMEKRNQKQCYDDIIQLPHHVSRSHPQMSIHDRAAQFAPFAALTAHGAAVRETARLTDQKIELDENCKAVLDQQIQLIQEQLIAGTHPDADITYFIKDSCKEGGAYVTVSGSIRKIDAYRHRIIMKDGTQIPSGDIAEIRLI